MEVGVANRDVAKVGWKGGRKEGPYEDGQGFVEVNGLACGVGEGGKGRGEGRDGRR
jgi:hypothetical protein